MESLNKESATKVERAAGPSGVPKEFLNPKSMLTPGLCGGVTMLITNTLAAQFGAPRNYTGLGISALFGLIVFAATSTTLWLRVVLWILNSLIIFSIALGTNQVGELNVRKARDQASVGTNVQFFGSWFMDDPHREDQTIRRELGPRSIFPFDTPEFAFLRSNTGSNGTNVIVLWKGGTTDLTVKVDPFVSGNFTYLQPNKDEYDTFSKALRIPPTLLPAASKSLQDGQSIITAEGIWYRF